MKKKILTTIICLLVISGCIFLAASHPASDTKPVKLKGNYTAGQLKSLHKLGFLKSANLNDKDLTYDKILNPKLYNEWEAKGFVFISDEGLTKICNENYLIIGEISDFKGEIPPANIDEITLMLNKLGNPEDRYILTHENGWKKEITRDDLKPERLNPDGSLKPEVPTNGVFSIGERNRGDNAYKYVKDIKMLYGCKDLKHLDQVFIEKVDMPLRIVAEISLMDTVGKNVRNFRIVPRNIFRDPIVIIKVDGGYVQLTHWTNINKK
ncbi:MAG TPA: hypothetical protein VGZ90_13400 [Puia sp.]|jgi:hypothetical protein|nr:hypothetical protein [Puia sp.]